MGTTTRGTTAVAWDGRGDCDCLPSDRRMSDSVRVTAGEHVPASGSRARGAERHEAA